LDKKGPLAGIRVIELTMNVLGPMAGQVLGDAGADVIKIESPEGDPIRKIGPSRTVDMGPYFLNLNRNKRSVALDLKRAPARAALLRLIAGADVFLHNIRPGAVARLGLDYASLAALNPRLVYASATGYRPGSSARDRPAFDDIIQGTSGLASLNGIGFGGPGAAPRYVPTVMADKVCGHTLASAVGMALFARERSGRGQEVHVPMMDTMVAFNLVEHLWGATIDAPEEGLGYGRMLTPNRRPYATADGFICVIASTDDQWRRLFGVIGKAELFADPRFATLSARTENIDEVLGVLTAALAEHPTAYWAQKLDAADLPNGPANSLQDLLDDDYLAEVGFFHRGTHPTEGAMTLLSPPVAFSQTPTSVRALPPKHGADTLAVLREAGLSEAEIAEATDGGTAPNG
jgi:crotonobetainyl-CoA:carnitine CoA-transferase CaiB-like acyl-CoA transferase